MGDAEKGRGTEKGLRGRGGGPTKGREDGEGALSKGMGDPSQSHGEPCGGWGKIESENGDLGTGQK